MFKVLEGGGGGALRIFVHSFKKGMFDQNIRR